MPLSNNGVMCCNEILYNSLFIKWGRGTEEICSMTVSCKEHQWIWGQAKGSCGSLRSQIRWLQFCPLWCFPLAPMQRESLLCGWSWAVPSQGACVPCAAECRGNPAGVCQLLSGLFHCCRSCRRWRCSHHCCNELCSVQSAVPPGKESAVVGDGHVGWEC